jgi:hypothetical protein
MYDNHPFVRREAARRARSETPDQRRRRWQREQREYERKEAQRQLEKIEEEERAQRAEELRLASRTPDQVAEDEAEEARAQAAWEAGAEQRERELEERLANTYRKRDDPYGTFGT